MKLLIFGTGDYYSKYKKWIKEDDIIALIDNDTEKQGKIYDHHEVISPYKVTEIVFDYIIILSVHGNEMKKQLLDLGVAEEKIIRFSDIYKYTEFCTGEKSIQIYGKSHSVVKNIMRRSDNAIVLMSHNLDLNGASLALFYMAKILKEKQYDVIFVSWNDGKLREYLEKEDIPVIIDSNMEMKSAKNIEWLQAFGRVVCNTVNYYQFLSERDTSQKFIWWLHDPSLFYESLDTELLYKIPKDNLKVCAAGNIAEQAMHDYRPDFEIDQLLYGIEDVKDRRRGKHEKIEIITVSNVQSYKGQDLLIDMLEMMDKHALEKIHIRVVGPQESQFAKEIKKRAKSLENTIEFLPPVDREKIAELLDSADVYICPSRVDSMSVAAGEAMRHGIPCIVSDAAGISAYIRDGENGFVFRSGDAEELTGKLLRLIQDKSLMEEMGRSSRKIYEDYFSMKVFSKRLLEVIRFFD